MFKEPFNYDNLDIKDKESSLNINDPVSHPSHYTYGNIEVIQAIDDWNLGFCLGNAVKYIARAGKKEGNSFQQDLEKAIWYINHEIDKHKGE